MKLTHDRRSRGNGWRCVIRNLSTGARGCLEVKSGRVACAICVSSEAIPGWLAGSLACAFCKSCGVRISGVSTSPISMGTAGLFNCTWSHCFHQDGSIWSCLSGRRSFEQSTSSSCQLDRGVDPGLPLDLVLVSPDSAAASPLLDSINVSPLSPRCPKPHPSSLLSLSPGGLIQSRMNEPQQEVVQTPEVFDLEFRLFRGQVIKLSHDGTFSIDGDTCKGPVYTGVSEC